MKSIYLVILAVFFSTMLNLTQTAQAQEVLIDEELPNSTAEPVETEEGEEEGRHISVMVGVGMFAPGLSLELGVFVTPDLMIGASYESGFDSIGFSSDERNSQSVYARQWFSDTTHVKLGASRRQFTKADSFGFGVHRDVTLDVALGNRWQWGAMALGVDWVGLNVPVYTASDTSSRGVGVQLLNVQVGINF